MYVAVAAPATVLAAYTRKRHGPPVYVWVDVYEALQRQADALIADVVVSFLAFGGGWRRTDFALEERRMGWLNPEAGVVGRRLRQFPSKYTCKRYPCWAWASYVVTFTDVA